MTRDTASLIISDAVERSLSLKVVAEVKYSESGHGDFSTNIAFLLSAEAGKSPKELAEIVAAEVKHPDVEKAEAAGAGYINLFLKPQYWIQQLKKIEPGFGYSDIGADQKVQVEFISANPTGPLTLANARGGYVGDVISNVLRSTGYTVVREYYVNDAGGQVAKLADSLRAEAGIEIEGERQYTGEYLAELLKSVDPRQVNDEEELERLAVSTCLGWIKDATIRLGIRFDEWFSEKSLVETNQTNIMLDWLKEHGLVYEKDDAKWLSSTKLGDDRDRVLVRRDGNPTYLLGDLTYHFDIFVGRKFDRAVKVWGADHAGQVESLKLTTQQFAPESTLDFVLLQFVRLTRSGKEVKMSKRAGTYVTVDELLDTLESGVGKQHAASVARWFFLSRSADKRIDFDLEIAGKESQSNPYFYVMYAYARAHSILSKTKERGMQSSNDIKSLNESQLGIMRQIAQWPELIASISQDYEVHKLTYFGYELARLFQDLYETDRIIDLPESEAESKIYFIQQFIVFMNVYFEVLRIEPTARLDRN